MQLTPDNVHRLIKECLFAEGEATDSMVRVDGITRAFGFDPKRVAIHSVEIGEMLAELPDQFHLSKGGGWSFLNACTDRHGNLWTG